MYAKVVVKHVFWWYFMLFYGKFQIIASVLVLFLYVSFLSVLFFYTFFQLGLLWTSQ